MATKGLKTLRKEAEEAKEKEDYSLFLTLSNTIKDSFPKNYYGYLSFVLAKTNNYKKYLPEDELKEVKKNFECAYERLKKDEKDKLKREFDEYVNDCFEVENLKKIRKNITGKYFLKELYNDGVTFINQNIQLASTYNLDGKKIVNIYDFIKGLFLFSCLVYNLIYRNALLILTIPFGIFGIITIYSFINMNFFGKRKLNSEKEYLSLIIEEANKKNKEIKSEIEKLDKNIEMLKIQKNDTMLKIPEVFLKSLENITIQNENEVASKIALELNSNNISTFTYLINEETNLNIDDIMKKIKPKVKDENDELSRFISNKIIEKKNSQKEIIMMKKVKPASYFIIAVLLVISILSIIVISNNFYELNFISFIVSSLAGIISMLIYNIKTGKHSSLIDTFNDNLLLTIFNSTLVYDLIYTSITNELKFTYGFIEIPLIFVLMFMGFVGVVSLLKYKNLMNKLRGE